MAGAGPDPELVVIGGDPVEVQLLPAVGGRLHRLRAFGQDLLRTPAAVATHVADPWFWGAYPMAPWCNRIAARPVSLGSRTVDLRPNFADGTAIHGQVAAIPWDRRTDGALTVRGGGDGWPWPYEAVERVTVEGATVRIALALTNLADEPMPAGIGLHPWFTGPLELSVAATRYVSNVEPDAPIGAVSGSLDLRTLGPVPAGLDGTWLDPADPAAEVRWPGLGLEATLRLGSDVPVCVAVASPADTGAVAIEPQTHAPWGLRRFLAGEPFGMTALAPGATLGLSIEIDIRRSG
jgi:aldose 1-epimerase